MITLSNKVIVERMQDTTIPKRICTESCMQQDEEEDQK